MYLRYTASGYIIISPKDDPCRIVDAMLANGYDEEFCFSLCFDPAFIARLMEAGFLVMSARIDSEENAYILLPKLHLVRSALFFENLHVKKSIKRFLGRYELRYDADFDYIVDRCVQVHGNDWLTPPLVSAIREIRAAADEKARAAEKATGAVRPVSFALYRNGKLSAGEFGVTAGRVYTSYSGYYDEDNAGTVQLVLAAQHLRDRGFAFFDLGMPLHYKYDLGAVDISPEEFVKRFREGTGKNRCQKYSSQMF
jgi:Leu/Phe-tRNA-protein transferase